MRWIIFHERCAFLSFSSTYQCLFMNSEVSMLLCALVLGETAAHKFSWLEIHTLENK